MSATNIPPSIAELELQVPDFCRRHGIARLQVLGSLAHGDQRPGSDVDLLATFRPEVHPGLDFFSVQDERDELLCGQIDLDIVRETAQLHLPLVRDELRAWFAREYPGDLES